MRGSGVFLLLLCAGCTGGFATGGAFVYQPDLSDSDRSSGIVGTVGGGVQIPVRWPHDNPLRGKHGIPDPEDARPNKMMLEAFAGVGDDVDAGDLVMAGAGIRIKLGYRRRFYSRFGFTYADLDPNDARGGHLGLGYDIFLSDDHRWSVAPEVMGYYLFQDKGGQTDGFGGGSVGVFLTYHWGRRRREKEDTLRDMRLWRRDDEVERYQIR